MSDAREGAILKFGKLHLIFKKRSTNVFSWQRSINIPPPPHRTLCHMYNVVKFGSVFGMMVRDIIDLGSNGN